MSGLYKEKIIINREGKEKWFNMRNWESYKSRKCKTCGEWYADAKQYWTEVHRHPGNCQVCSSKLK